MKTIRTLISISLCVTFLLSFTISAFAIAFRAKTAVNIRDNHSTSATILGQLNKDDWFNISSIYTAPTGRVWYYGVPDENADFYKAFGSRYGWASAEDDDGNMLFT